MTAKLQPRLVFRIRVRPHFASLALLGALAACAPEEEDEGPPFMQQPSPIVEAGVDTGVVLAPPPPVADAGNPMLVPDASMPGPDTGMMVPLDAGMMMPGVDAGGDAGPLVVDAGATGDAAETGAGACPTYENFGRMFMMTYCVACHTGTTAQRMVRLDTLAGVTTQKAAIQRVAVNSMAMPPSGMKPSAAERQKLGEWLNCGPM